MELNAPTKKRRMGEGKLAGKFALVTAAAQGIGEATARMFAAEGASVLATDINETKLAELKDVEGIRVAVLDVSNSEAVTKLVASLQNLDILFNCAGYGHAYVGTLADARQQLLIVHDGNILHCSEKDWDTSWNVNVKSMFFLCKQVIPKMMANGGGSIVNMASVISSIKGAANRFVYGTTKAAVIGLTKAIAIDFIEKNIRCNAICPGTVDTPSLHEHVNAQPDPEKAYNAFIARQKMGRLGKTEEIAALCTFLASDEAAFITGTEYVIDGGWTL